VKVARRGRKWREEHPDEVKANNTAHYTQHKEEANARSHIYYWAHREEIRAKAAARYEANKEKISAENATYRAENQGKIRAQRIEAKYGISESAFEVLLQTQNRHCAICPTPLANDRHTHVDHDHATGRVRGLLCGPCNVGLGNFRDDLKRLASAARYLRLQRDKK
jgi:hypothetical protein